MAQFKLAALALVAPLAHAQVPLPFVPAGELAAPLDRACRFEAVDLDGDGRLDLVTTTRLQLPENSLVWYRSESGDWSDAEREVVGATSGIASFAVGDFDSDGDFDLAYCGTGATTPSGSTTTLSWYRNEGGSAGFSGAIALQTYTESGVSALTSSDLDGDGTTDLALIEKGRIQLFRNLDGSGTFASGSEQIGLVDSLSDQLATADLDGDGRNDLLAFGSGPDLSLNVLLSPGTSGGTWPATNIYSGLLRPQIADLGDLDGDGDVDVLVSLGTGSSTPQLAWIESLGGGSFNTPAVLATGTSTYATVAIVDVDGDGDADALAGNAEFGLTGPSFNWHANLGNGSFAPGQPLSDDLLGTCGALGADLTGDGRIDLLRADQQGSALTLLTGQGGPGQFAPPLAVAALTASRTTGLGDADGDGDLDLLVLSSFPTWHENVSAPDRFDVRGPVTTTSTRDFDLGDLDGDGRLDFLGAGSDGAWWNRALPAPFAFGNDIVLRDTSGGSSQYIEVVRVADVDGDGDADAFVGGADSSENLWWYENLQGNGPDSAARLVANSGVRYGSLEPADVDGDGDLDLVAASLFSNGGVQWFENLDGAGQFSSPVTLLPGVSSVGLHARDLDGDGDVDALTVNSAGITNPSTALWLENLDGAGSFGPAILINDALPLAGGTVVEDLDGDGDPDLLVFGGEALYVMENVDGLGRFGPIELVGEQSPTEPAGKAQALSFGDVDGDSRPDALLSTTVSTWWHRGGIDLTVFVDVPPTAAIGAPLEVLNDGPVGATYTTYFSYAPAEIPLAPYGVLQIAPPVRLLLGPLPYSGAGGTSFDTINVPPLPALVGLQAYLQSLAIGAQLPDLALLGSASSTLFQ